MQSGNEDLCYGCLFCKTGAEESLAEKLMQKAPEVRAIAPKKRRVRRSRGRAEDEYVLLFPGYLFYCADTDFDPYFFVRDDNVYRLLLTDKNDWRLMGRDRELVEGFFKTGGIIDLSRAYYEGNRIRIAEGFLKDYEGQIIRVNRRNRTAQIRLDISGSASTLWLGFELICEEGAQPQPEK